ncbi:TolC family protein, partial [Acidithiobacillus caldus]
TRKGYEVGTRSIIDLLQTATDYIRAEQDYNVALYNQVLARVQLKAAAGQLDLADLSAVNGLLGGGAGTHEHTDSRAAADQKSAAMGD